MGLCSCSWATRRLTSATGTPASRASSSCWACSCGTNSCSGGSSRRTVTGRPSIAVKMPTKSSRWKGSSLASADSRWGRSEARIIWRTALMRSPSKNMCSVRHRPMPTAPKSRARRASAGVSAFVRTFMRAWRSAHCMMVAKSPPRDSGTVRDTLPSITSPVVPSIESTSWRPKVRPATVRVPASVSIESSPAPTTQHLPQPTATTAAWLVLPPVLVRMPTALCMPSTSSGLVSLRTSSTCSPACARSTASAAVKASLPVAAPGLAPMPLVSTVTPALSLAWKLGRSSCVRSPAGIRLSAVFSSISFSFTISTATRTAAVPVRLPLRVWSMNSLPFSTVNSMSCMSL